MKIMLRVKKYVFVVAGNPVIWFDRYQTPYRVYRRVVPFVYKDLGICGFSDQCTKEDIQE